ncbi:hypothetical protein EJ06DRAFT_527938 [Trichodelitschia bisporula]|uniref:Uncharacterized protein n=1 Tax=Trichodelitschia bisporula TaxID=703511 RepID=A0A6G1I462_9PEZI|nr:hypothetical protein EJ06DRAFT_527938 [Trichodelitschia bisporula]
MSIDQTTACLYGYPFVLTFVTAHLPVHSLRTTITSKQKITSAPGYAGPQLLHAPLTTNARTSTPTITYPVRAKHSKGISVPDHQPQPQS